MATKKNISRFLIFGFILIFGGWLKVFAEVTPAQFRYLRQLLDLNRLEEMIAEGEQIKSQNLENLELRSLLFQAYLNYGLSLKAEEEITFIENRIRDARTLHLRALQAHHTNNIPATLSLLNQITEKRYAPPYLLHFQILMQQKNFSEAEIALQQYRGLEGEDQDWFFNYGKYLLAQYKTEEGRNRVREHIEKYTRTFPANHRQMYLRADYHASQDQFGLALDYINKALYLSSSRPDYLDQKLYYLYRDQQFDSLIKNIDQNSFPNKEKYTHYQWVKSFIHFINLKKENSFVLHSPEYLSLVLGPLTEILEQHPENAIIRYFAEELLLANTLTEDKRRMSFADARYQNVVLNLEKGQWSNTQFIFSRLLQLSPENPTYLEVYLEYLRYTKQYERYVLEAEKYLSLTQNTQKTNQEHQQIPIRKQLAEKILSETITGRHQLSKIIPPSHLKVLLTYSPRPYRDSWDQPYLETLVGKMMKESLENTSLLQVDLRRQTRVDQLGYLLDQGDYDYHIDFTLTDQAQVLTLTLNVRNRQKVVVYNLPQIFYGKDRYHKMTDKLQQIAHMIFPKVGEVIIVKNRQAVLSLGLQHGAVPQDRVALFKNGNQIGSFPLEIVDNYYSLITIDKIFVLSQTEVGDRVILEK